jgi:hypothetical protein
VVAKVERGGDAKSGILFVRIMARQRAREMSSPKSWRWRGGREGEEVFM